jgi:8-amino-7-oxononanoate synthase
VSKFHPSFILTQLKAELDRLKAQELYRELAPVAGIDLCSNNYLGLATDSRLADAVRAALADGVPVGSTGSRLLSGNHAIWDEFESELAEFIGSEAALFFGSGYAANVGLLASILGPEDVVFSDASNHASLIDGIRLSGAQKVLFPHGDLDYLEDRLRRQAPSAGRKLVVVESLFSMEGDRFPLAELVTLGQSYGADVVVDEAHATGVFGPEGRGLVAEAGLTKRVLATVHTCGKALGGVGGWVASSQTLRDYLINRARPFIFSTALPPYLAAQIRAAIRLARAADAQRAHLLAISALLRRRLAEVGFDCGRSESQIVPVIFGPNRVALQAAEILRRRGFGVRAIRPPSVPPGTARLRLSLNAKLTVAVVERLATALGEAREEIRSMSRSARP